MANGLQPLLVNEKEAEAIAQLLNAMRNVPGYRPGVGIVFPPPRPPTIGTGDDGPMRLRVKEIFNDYLCCHSWNGTTEGTADILVAKPYELRHVLANYPQLTDLTTVSTQTVTATDGSTTETWKVTPDYVVDGEIEADRVAGTGVTVDDDLYWIDANNAGRGWGVEE